MKTATGIIQGSGIGSIMEIKNNGTYKNGDDFGKWEITTTNKLRLISEEETMKNWKGHKIYAISSENRLVWELFEGSDGEIKKMIFDDGTGMYDEFEKSK